jgi:predicted membrane channel-forming protein YqfA (hemolysin III family)
MLDVRLTRYPERHVLPYTIVFKVIFPVIMTSLTLYRYYSIPGDGLIPVNSLMYLLVGFWYLSGLAIYGLKIPERFFPKTFDYIGNSHNIWHVFVILGAFTHY